MWVTLCVASRPQAEIEARLRARLPEECGEPGSCLVLLMHALKQLCWFHRVLSFTYIHCYFVEVRSCASSLLLQRVLVTTRGRLCVLAGAQDKSELALLEFCLKELESETERLFDLTKLKTPREFRDWPVLERYDDVPAPPLLLLFLLVVIVESCEACRRTPHVLCMPWAPQTHQRERDVLRASS